MTYKTGVHTVGLIYTEAITKITPHPISGSSNLELIKEVICIHSIPIETYVHKTENELLL